MHFGIIDLEVPEVYVEPEIDGKVIKEEDVPEEYREVHEREKQEYIEEEIQNLDKFIQPMRDYFIIGSPTARDLIKYGKGLLLSMSSM